MPTAGPEMKTGALWPDQLAEEEHAALDPGIPDRLERRPDVLIVGGGVVGVATALACVQAGLGSVVLVERQRLGAGATGGAGGLMMAESRRGVDPAWLVDFGRASLALWRELEAGIPGGVGLIEVDWLGLEPFLPEFAADLPAEAERLDPVDVRQLMPDLARPVAGIRVRRQARVNPLRAVARLAGALPSVCTGVDVLGATVQAGRVVAVSTSAGELSPGAVVFATGGPPRLAGLELDVPSGHVKGHIVTTEPVPVRLPGTVSGVGTQLENGRLLAGATLDVGDDSPLVRPEIIASIRADLGAAVPALGDAPLSHQWCCFRPTHPDGMPIVDRVPGLENAWVTSGHFRSDILMALATGRALAAWIGSGQQPGDVVGLEAGRFAAHRPLTRD